MVRPRAGASVGTQEKEKELTMTKIPNIADIIAAHADQDKTLRESAADLGDAELTAVAVYNANCADMR